MPFTVQTVDGQLAASKGTLYTVPASTQAFVKGVTYYNAGATLETVNLWVKPGSTSRLVASVQLAAGERMEATEFALEEDALIEGSSSNATTVNYFISLVEET
jgi:hypothetical protein